MQLSYQTPAVERPIRFVRGPGFGIIGGVVAMAVGGYLASCGLNILDMSRGNGLVGLGFLVVGGLIALGGLVRALGVSGSRIDLGRGTIKTWRGLLVPMSVRTYSLAHFSIVRIGTRMEGSGRSRTLVYTASLTGHGGTVVFCVAGGYMAARRTATYIAQCLGYALLDETEATPVVREAVTLGVGLRDRERAPIANVAELPGMTNPSPGVYAERGAPAAFPDVPIQTAASDISAGAAALPAMPTVPPSSRIRANWTPECATLHIPRPSFGTVMQFPMFMVLILGGIGVALSLLIMCFGKDQQDWKPIVAIPLVLGTVGTLLSLPFVLPVAWVSTTIEAGRFGLRIHRRGLIARSRQEIPAASIDELRDQFGVVSVITPQKIIQIRGEGLNKYDSAYLKEAMRRAICA